MTALPSRVAGREVTLPEIAVPPHVLVVSLTTVPVADDPAGLRRLAREWVALGPGLKRHRRELGRLLEIATGQARLGEVAAFLAYRDVGRQLVGGASVLSLEVVEPLAGSPGERAASMAVHLRRTASSLGHVEGLSEVATRSTVSGVDAARVRFLAVLPPEAGASEEDAVSSPVVEVCRWLFPVPGHADLVWALAFQTTDLEPADELVDEFDQMAASLTWVAPDV